MQPRKQVVIGMLGSTLDSGFHQERWNRWRPTLSLCKHTDLPVDRFELIYDPKFKDIANVVMADIQRVSPRTEVRGTEQSLKDAWDFVEVYAALHDFARGYAFDTEEEEYLVHITTGIARAADLLVPAHRIAALPRPDGADLAKGPEEARAGRKVCASSTWTCPIPDRLASRFGKEQKEARTFLKSGIRDAQ